MRFILSIFLILQVMTVNAGKIIVGVSAGTAITSANNFRDEDSFSHHVGYRTSDISFSLGQSAKYKFKHQGGNDTFVRLDAYFLRAAYIFDMPWLELEVGGGLYDWEAEAFLADRKVGSSSDTEIYYDLRLVKMFGSSRLVGIQLDWKHIDDVAGDALDIIEFGVQFNF